MKRTEGIENQADRGEAGVPLQEDALDKVSGGRNEKQYTESFCLYCRTSHRLAMYYPCTVKFNGCYYHSAKKYECGTHGTFYSLDIGGETIYLDAMLNKITL